MGFGEAFCFGLGILFCPGLFVGLGGGSLWGDQSPPRPPKCALKGAFHEGVRLGVFVFALAFCGFW